MTITIEKKHFLIFGGILVLLAVIFLIAKIGFGKKIDYEATAKDAKLNAYTVVGLSSTILSDYQKTWSNTINGSIWVKDENGERHLCSDFNDAISYKMRCYIHEGYFDVIDSLSNVVKDDMKLMDDASDKYKDVQKTFVAMYGDMNSIVSLVKEPKGSLMTFGTKVNELMMSFDKNFKETDLKVSVSDDELKDKVLDLYKVVYNKKFEKEIEKNKAIEEYYYENKKNGEDFMAENAKKEGVITLPSGVQYKVIKEGKGPIPVETSDVTLHYEGRLIDGTVFDSSYKRGEPVTFPVCSVIKGWKEVLCHMPAGSEWEVYIPQELAYGEREQGKDIKPFSALIFKIELFKVKTD
jgi:FKBP-type peptidyl-prolyl cis-trans isomerase